MKILILISFIVFGSLSYSQDFPPPPAESIAGKEEQVLIDVLLEISKFETYFIHRSTDRIEVMGFEKKWSEKEILVRKNKISYDSFIKQNNFYNLLSDFSKKELEELIEFSKKINDGYSEPKVFFTTPLIERRIDTFVEDNYLK